LGIMFMAGVLPALVQYNVYAEKIDRNNWIDWSLPRSVSEAPFEGQRYEAEVPDTIDLVDNANYALNMATRLWVPEWGYELFNGIHMADNPPTMQVGHGGLLSEGAKILEAIPLLRVMTGSTKNIDVDEKAVMSIVRITGKDGLCYQPVENRPWAFFDEFTKTLRQPYCDIFGEGRQLLTYARWYQHDHNPLWKELALRKTHRLIEIALEKEGTLYFRLSRGYTPWDDPKIGPVVPIGDDAVYDARKGMVGTPASYIVGWIPQAGGIWYRLTKEKPFQELSRGLARYLQIYGEMIDPDSGKFLADHSTHVTHSLLSNLSWALTFGDQEMAEWVKKGYEYHLHHVDPCSVGILFSCEACEVSDTIGIGIMLTQAGMGDYWEEVDRLIRNTYLNMQVTSADWMKNRPLAYKKELEPGCYQPDDAADRCVGVWREHLERDYLDSSSCCNGNCSRILYYIWDNIITDEDNKLRINLLYNRASLSGDIDSWLPYEGRIKVTMKKAKDHVLVRIPDWVDRDCVTGMINGNQAAFAWSGNYVDVGKVRAGDRIVVEFPVKVRKINAALAVLERERSEDEKWTMQDCQVTMKGNTVIDLSPVLAYPLSKQIKYRADEAPIKKVTRFVSKERFLF
jgi:hypothetical protein